VLLSRHLESLKRGSPVYYRGVEVGAVQDHQLSSNATTVDIQVFIRQRYANLVRSGSKFWNVSGVDVRVGLFRGAEINVESLRGNRIRDPERSEGRAGKGWDGIPSLRQAGKGVVRMDTRNTDSA